MRIYLHHIDLRQLLGYPMKYGYSLTEGTGADAAMKEYSDTFFTHSFLKIFNVSRAIALNESFA